VKAVERTLELRAVAGCRRLSGRARRGVGVRRAARTPQELSAVRCAFCLRPSHGAACSHRSQGQGKAGPHTNCVGARVGYVRDLTPGYRVAPRLRRACAGARRVHQGHGGVHQHRAGQQPQPAHPPGDHHHVRHVWRGHVLPSRGRAPALTLPPPRLHRRATAAPRACWRACAAVPSPRALQWGTPRGCV